MQRPIRLAFAAIALISCAPPLDLPPPPKAAPVIDSFSPEFGYSGDKLLIHGRNFAPVAADNEVAFNYATVRADDFENGDLVVHVPEGPDTGTTIGPLSVTTPEGESNATKDSFNYYGIGHPNTGTKVGDVKVLHRQEGIAAVNGDVLLPSALFRRLFSHHGLNAALSSKPHAIAVSADGATVFVGYADKGVAAIDPRTGSTLASTKMQGLFIRHLLVGRSLAGGVAVHAVGTDVDFGNELVTFDGAALTARPARVLPVRTVRGATIGADGRTLYLVAERDGSDGVERGVLALDAEDATDAGSWFASPDGGDPTGPIAAATVDGAERVAVALDDGSIAMLDASLGRWTTNVPTGSDTRVAALVTMNLPDAPLIAAAKPDDLSLVAVDPAASSVAWTAWLGTLPTELAFDPSNDRLYADDDASNGVDDLDAASGVWLDRMVFDVGLGDADGMRLGPAADFDPGDEVHAHHMLVLARRLEMVVAINDDTLELDETPLALADGTSPPLGLVGTTDGTVYVVHAREVGRFVGIHGDQNTTEQLVIQGLPDDLTRAAVMPDGGLVLGSAHAVTLWERDADGTFVKQAVGLTHPTGHLEELDARPDGNVLVLWQETSGEPALSGGLYTPKNLASRLAPIAAFDQSTDLHGYFGLVDVEPGPTLFFNGCDGYVDPSDDFANGRCAVRLGDELGARDLRFSNVKEQAPLGVSPDRRYFLWTRETTDDRVLRLAWAGDAQDDMYDYTSWQAAGEFKTPGLDPSGEWLYVPIPSLDEVSVFK